MEIIHNSIFHNLDINKYFEYENICFLDIETTGFSRKKNIIYLIGILSFDFDQKVWNLRQFFANSMEKEEILLKEIIPVLSAFDKIITYNGDAFDLPFIESRMNYYNIEFGFDKTKSFDIYKIIKKNKHFLDLPDLKLKTIEKSLGFYREDMYSGGDCIKFYYDYLKFGETSLKDNILKHNYDDLVHMLDIISILDVLEDSKSISFSSRDNNKFTINDMEVKGDMLVIKGTVLDKLEKNIQYYDSCLSIASQDHSNLTFTLELKKGYITEEEMCFFIDTSSVNYVNELLDLSGFNLPKNIVVLIIENKYVLDNIKNLLKKLLDNIIQ